ncbi:GntR family transcriptional regulator, partial [Lacticaseibacillus rhamnosus]
MQDPRGITSLDLLERALADGDTHAFTFFAFDLCYLDGRSLVGARLIDRKRALEGLIDPLVDARSQVQFSQHVEGEANALGNLGAVYGRQGHYEQAAEYLQQAIVIHREVGDRIGEAYALDQLGVVYGRQGCYEQAADRIRNRIVKGDFRLGEALSETTLATELGISKTPVREAFLILKTEGLVDILPQRGTFGFR